MKLTPTTIQQSVRQQLRAMGAEDRLRRIPLSACPFAAQSNAARILREGWEARWKQMGLFEAKEIAECREH